MFSTENENKSAIAEICIKNLKLTSFKKLTANDSKSSLRYFNKLVHRYKNTIITLLVKNLLKLIIQLY